MNGEVEVKRLGQRLGFLSDGAFFGEPPMLGDKLIGERTRTVEAITDVHLCFITAVRRPDWGTNEVALTRALATTIVQTRTATHLPSPGSGQAPFCFSIN